MFSCAVVDCSEVLVLLVLDSDVVPPFLLLLPEMVKDLLWRHLLFPATAFQADKLVVHGVRMLAHDVLLCSLSIFERDDFLVLLALKTANPFFPASPFRLCTKFQPVVALSG